MFKWYMLWTIFKVLNNKILTKSCHVCGKFIQVLCSQLPTVRTGNYRKSKMSKMKWVDWKQKCYKSQNNHEQNTRELIRK